LCGKAPTPPLGLQQLAQVNTAILSTPERKQAAISLVQTLCKLRGDQPIYQLQFENIVLFNTEFVASKSIADQRLTEKQEREKGGDQFLSADDPARVLQLSGIGGDGIKERVKREGLTTCPHLCSILGKIAWSQGDFMIAHEWLMRSVLLNRDWGDFWALLFKLESQVSEFHSLLEETRTECENANPQNGILWPLLTEGIAHPYWKVSQ
ncbi:MAG: hypothetical protein EZS28_054220, partial [Streblomastix strix]